MQSKFVAIYMTVYNTSDEDREVETSCYRAVWFCLDTIMKFLDYSIPT